ncbi:MAG TPA: hypothetical protein VNT58_06710 [Gaiellaceae bacterium]|nr:hypothetical protein [Gaiellaceae bacterium]
MSVRFIDEIDGAVGWIEDAKLQRTAHALAHEGRVWLIDPIEGDGVEERVRALGEPAGVLQLLDRHNRDGAAWAARLGVPLHVAPTEVEGTPFSFLPIARRRFWSEVALWWPERRILVAADALGTIPHYFRLAGERIGVHPLLRLTPPRALRGLDPEHVLVGHGEGVHAGNTAAALADALAHSRRRFVRLPLELPKLRTRV